MNADIIICILMTPSRVASVSEFRIKLITPTELAALEQKSGTPSADFIKKACDILSSFQNCPTYTNISDAMQSANSLLEAHSCENKCEIILIQPPDVLIPKPWDDIFGSRPRFVGPRVRYGCYYSPPDSCGEPKPIRPNIPDLDLPDVVIQVKNGQPTILRCKNGVIVRVYDVDRGCVHQETGRD